MYRHTQKRPFFSNKKWSCLLPEHLSPPEKQLMQDIVESSLQSANNSQTIASSLKVKYLQDSSSLHNSKHSWILEAAISASLKEKEHSPLQK